MLISLSTSKLCQAGVLELWSKLDSAFRSPDELVVPLSGAHMAGQCPVITEHNHIMAMWIGQSASSALADAAIRISTPVVPGRRFAMSRESLFE